MVNLSQNNVSSKTWAHGVNSTQQLLAAFKSNVDMIEADIVLGHQNNNLRDMEPIMAHPPAMQSDLTLKEFLSEVRNYNNSCRSHMKGIKLDFKSIEVFENSLNILDNLLPELSCPVWLNADILPGPVDQTDVAPVSPDRFLAGCARFPSAVLSIGWTTRWGPNYVDGAYTEEHINNMLDVIKRNNIAATQHAITFPVRAGIAANSENALQKLLKSVSGTNKATLTIWSSPDDNVDIEKLRKVICSFGPERAYLDLPDSLQNKLGLPDMFSSSTAACKSNVLIKLSIVIAGVILAGIWLRR